jgi:zona occludens toxin (predicted ATPase)
LKFEDLLKIALIAASIIQFYLSFVKGRNKKGEYGNILLKLNMDGNKRRFLAVLLIGICGYFIYVIIKNNVSTLGMLIVIYFLLSIYDFSKMKIITSEGIGQKSFYSNSYYNFTQWNKVVEWQWCQEKQNLLLIKIQKKSKISNKQWTVLNFERETINKIFQENAKNKEFST